MQGFCIFYDGVKIIELIIGGFSADDDLYFTITLFDQIFEYIEAFRAPDGTEPADFPWCVWVGYFALLVFEIGVEYFVFNECRGEVYF